MPVLVTGATGTVGRALVRRLVAEGGQVRAYVRRDDPDLRGAGVHVAVGAHDDVERLEAALTRVHTVVHLVGDWWPPDGDYDLPNRDSTEAAAIAARAADVRRFLFLSMLGADPASSNALLAAKGKAEEHVRAGGFEHAIFRCVPIVGDSLARVFARMRRGPVVALPCAGGRLTPLALPDVVEALVAADAREEAVRGTWDLGGPETMTLDRLADVVAGPARKTHAGVLSPAPRALAEVLCGDMTADSSEAIARFGLRQSPARRA